MIRGASVCANSVNLCLVSRSKPRNFIYARQVSNVFCPFETFVSEQRLHLKVSMAVMNSWAFDRVALASSGLPFTDTDLQDSCVSFAASPTDRRDISEI